MLALKGPMLRPVRVTAPHAGPHAAASLPAVVASAGVPAARAAAEAAAGAPIQDSVWPKGTVQVLGRDRALYAEGAPAVNWYRLLSGTVRIARTLADGRRHISEFVFPGGFFGFAAGPLHVESAEAVEPATLVAYSCAAIEQHMAQDHTARRAIRNLLVERLSAAQERVLSLGSLNASERLGAFLLAMARRGAVGEPGPGACPVAALPMSRGDIADYLGLTVETVSRIFTALRRRGAIRLAAVNRIEILDPGALAGSSGACRRLFAAGAADDFPLRRCA